MDEMRIDENLLNDLIHLTTHDEKFQHRGLRNLLEMVAMMGYRHRSNYRVVLFQQNELSQQLPYFYLINILFFL